MAASTNAHHAHRQRRHQTGADAGPGGHALAAAEAEVDGKEVAEEGGDAGDDGQGVRVEVGGLLEEAGEPDGGGPFGEVEQEHQDAEAADEAAESHPAHPGWEPYPEHGEQHDDGSVGDPGPGHP